LSQPGPRLYRELAAWWPLLSPPQGYFEEATFYRRLLEAACTPPPQSLLELGSGGGHNASHLKARFALTLVDRSPEMLAVSRALNPECEHVVGDMRSVRLGRLFDAVFIHDAIDYLTTEAELGAAFATAFAHCRPGGALLVVPDHVRERFEPRAEHGGHDAPDGRGMRYLAWSFDPDPDDTLVVTEFAYLLRERDGSVRVEHDRHVTGLFPRDTWLRLLREAGFAPSVVEDPTQDAEGREVFVGRKPRVGPG
jgi:SAM-dependent methyltransferase